MYIYKKSPVNALVRTLYTNDYERAINDLSVALGRCRLLEQAISNYGLVIECDNDGNIILTECK